jgi:hypothetical protein
VWDGRGDNLVKEFDGGEANKKKVTEEKILCFEQVVVFEDGDAEEYEGVSNVALGEGLC